MSKRIGESQSPKQSVKPTTVVKAVIGKQNISTSSASPKASIKPTVVVVSPAQSVTINPQAKKK